MTLARLTTELAPLGLVARGGFHPRDGDGVPAAHGGPARTLVLIGNIGGAMWPVFAKSSEAGDGAPSPLDRWTRRVLEPLAAQLGARALFPFGGRPYLPFQRWAMRSEPVAPSPLGILIHPVFGLWHAYRAAYAFAEELALPAREEAPVPCVTCADKPCLSACPVGAFGGNGFDVGACAAHINAPAGRPCMEGGCLARAACPVGREHAYATQQLAFHMRAFRAARS